MATDGVGGETEIDSSITEVTVSLVDPVMPLIEAEMVAVPALTAVARPALEMVATETVSEAQVTWLVMSCVELSVKVAVAVNCSVVPAAMEGLAGVTAMDCRAAGVTVTLVDPVMLPLAALMVEVPVPTAVTRPPVETVATVASDEVQVAELVRSWVE